MSQFSSPFKINSSLLPLPRIVTFSHCRCLQRRRIEIPRRKITDNRLQVLEADWQRPPKNLYQQAYNILLPEISLSLLSYLLHHICVLLSPDSSSRSSSRERILLALQPRYEISSLCVISCLAMTSKPLRDLQE